MVTYVEHERTPDPRTDRTDTGPTSLQVLERMFSILDLFSLEHPEWTTTEMARECGLPIPTTHRLLAALQAREFLSRDERTKRFRLGPAALELGERAKSALDIRTLTRPLLQELARKTGETALLTVLSEDRERAVCLERVESRHPLRLSVEPGLRLPLHAGASQKVLLAFMQEDEIERVLSKPLERMWLGTLTLPSVLREDLARIRREGFARSLEEQNPGAWGLAVPIFDAAGAITAGIGVAGPCARATRDELAAHLQHLRQSAVAIADHLGLRVRHAREDRREARIKRARLQGKART